MDVTQYFRKSKGNSKYHAQKSNGYASRKENRRANELKLLERQGLIKHLREQVRYEIIPRQYGPDGKLLERPCYYIADFVYTDKNGNLIVEDTKGYRTEVYKIKRKLMLYTHGIRITEK